jgi:hypothetical protein
MLRGIGVIAESPCPSDLPQDIGFVQRSEPGVVRLLVQVELFDVVEALEQH